MPFLLENITSPTIGDSVKGQGSEKQIIIYADDFGGGQVSLETSFDGENWAPIQYNFSDAIFTDSISFTCPKISSECYIRASFSAGPLMVATNVNVFWG